MWQQLVEQVKVQENMRANNQTAYHSRAPKITVSSKLTPKTMPLDLRAASRLDPI